MCCRNSYNVKVLVFLIILGAMVSLMNRAGGSAAFGKWAGKRIKTRVGAQLATIALGMLLFIIGVLSYSRKRDAACDR